MHLGLDFFDASINRVAAWTIGVRSTLKALLMALVEPTAKLREAELRGDYTSRLAMLEEIKTLPFGAVWDYYCLRNDVPVGMQLAGGSQKVRERCVVEAEIEFRGRKTAVVQRQFLRYSRFRLGNRNLYATHRGGFPLEFSARCL